jgi:hypothetical protein
MMMMMMKMMKIMMMIIMFADCSQFCSKNLSIFIFANLVCSFFLFLLNKFFLSLYSFDLAFLHNDGVVLVASWCVDRISYNVSQSYVCVDCDG